MVKLNVANLAAQRSTLFTSCFAMELFSLCGIKSVYEVPAVRE